MNFIKFFALLFLFSLSFQGFTQTTKKHVYNAKVFLKNGEKVSGLLYSVDSTSLQLIRGKSIDTSKLFKVSASQIKNFKLKRKGGNLGAIALGAGVGAVVGVLAGLSEDESEIVNDVKDEFGAKVLFVTVPIGAGLGALVAGKSLYYSVDNDSEPFSIHTEELRRYSIITE